MTAVITDEYLKNSDFGSLCVQLEQKNQEFINRLEKSTNLAERIEDRTERRPSQYDLNAYIGEMKACKILSNEITK